ncbi:MAG: phosphatidate cytidylyltransferase [Pseudomonadota bacterium]
MNQQKGRWSDLALRLGSGISMLVIGVWGVWMGGWIFAAMVSTVAALMIWEFTRLVSPERGALAAGLSLVAGISLLLATRLPILPALSVLTVAPLIGIWIIDRMVKTYGIYVWLILVAGLGLLLIRATLGVGWMAWFVAVVVATDVFGYFAGKTIGGPKLWPRLSPKKTWAGAVAGWIGAGLMGTIFSVNSGLTVEVISLSVALSIASQAGDIVESAIKRHVGVKDASGLIPGHGGMLDRFDGMMGASLFLMAFAAITGFPEGFL